MRVRGNCLNQIQRNFNLEENDIVTLVDVDFTEYRKRIDNRAVKRTVPQYLINLILKQRKQG